MTPDRMAKIYATAFPEFRPWTTDEFGTLLSKEAMQSFATDAGFALFQITGQQGEIVTIAVTPDAQRKGNGTQLLKQMIKAAKEHNLSEIILEVSTTNQEAIHFYEAFAFEQIAIRKAYYRLRTGDKADALIYRLSL